MSKISELASRGVRFQPLEEEAPPAQEDGSFVRGLKKAAYQIPQTVGGSTALIGDMLGADGMRDYGMSVYQNNTDKVEALTRDSDSLTNVLQGNADAGAWLGNAAGYATGQAATALATGGLGGFIGSQLAKRGIREVVARGAQSAMAKQVAGKVAAKGAQAGAVGAMFGSNVVQEAGSIYPEAVHVADGEGRTLDAGDKARVVGAALGAAGVDTAMEAIMLGRVAKGGRGAGESMLRAGVRELPAGAAREAVTEGIQTGIERWGARQELSTADAIRDYVDSAGIGAVGGGMGGAASIISAKKVPESGPLTRAANAGIDEQILQLQHDPQPLISFPDGSVGHKQDLEAYLSQFDDPEERMAQHRIIMGRDPDTGKRPEPAKVEEPTSANNEANEAANMKAWAARHDGVSLPYAQALIAAPGAKGMDLMIVPHPKGKSYTVVPSKWLTLDTQAKYGALQKGDEGMLPGPDREAAGGAIRVDSEGGAAPETYGEQVRTGDAKRSQAAAEAEEAARREELGTPVPHGTKAPPKAVKEPEPLAPVMNKAGKPFATEFAAKRMLKSFAETHELVDTGDGWVLEPKKAAMVDAAAHEAATSHMNDLPQPTDAQKEAGNYRKGHTNVHGLDIAIENPRGSERSGKRPDGSTWSHTMSDHYGYIKRTVGADEEQIDVYVGPKPDGDKVFVVDQLHQETGGFDEHKAMMGYPTQAAAVRAYKSNFDKGWKVGPVKAMSVDEFKAWLKGGDTTAPASAAPDTTSREDGTPAVAGPEPAQPAATGEKMIQTVAGPMTVDAYVDLPVNQRPARIGGVGSSNAAQAKASAEEEAQAAAAKKEANKGKSIEQRRADAVLDRPTKFPPQAGLGNRTRRDSMRSAVEQERAIVEKQVADDAARKADQAVMDRMSRAGYMIDHSNENIPEVKAAREARDRLKANKYTKPEYRVYSGRDTDGSFFVISKTEFDYAQSLKSAEKLPDLAPKQVESASEAGKSETKGEKDASRAENTAAATDTGADAEAVVPAGNVQDGAPAEEGALAKRRAKNDRVAAAVDQAAANLAARKAGKATEVPVGNDDSVIPSGNESAADDAPDVDTGADIPTAFYRKIKVKHDVWLEEEQRFQSHDVRADKALKSAREDQVNLQKLLDCLRG
jgi:hypothetical protein